MADLLEPSQVAAFRDVFDSLDLNGTGRVDKRELGVVFRALGIDCTEAEIMDIISRVDVDGTGTLDFAEFLNLMTGALKDKSPEAEVDEAFRFFDRRRAGLITVESLRDASASLGESIREPDLVAMVAEADVSHRGGISKDDFRTLLRTNT